MEIECPSCGQSAQISEQIVEEEGTEVTCPECSIDFIALPGGFTTEVEDTDHDSEPDSLESGIGGQEDNSVEGNGASTDGQEEGLETTGTRPVREALEEAAEQGRGEIEVSVEDLDQLEEDRREFLLCHVVPEVESGGAELAKVLIELGTDPSAMDEDGKPALHHAAPNGKPEVVRVLIEGGADANERGYTSRTPLHWSAREDSEGVAKVLVEAGAEIEAEHEGTGMTPLHMAAREGSKRVLQILLEAGAEIDAEAEMVISQKNTPLYFAARNGEVEIAEILIEAGSGVDVRNDEGQTPLHEAAFGGNVQMIELLLREGADAGALDNRGLSALGRAIPVADNLLDVTKVLVEAGAPIDSGGFIGGTPLHDAAHDCGPELVEYLIEAGSDVNAINSAGKTPLDQVRFRKKDGDADPRVKRLLKREDAKPGEAVSQGSSQAKGCLGFF